LLAVGVILILAVVAFVWLAKSFPLLDNRMAI
jgi:hypothetical protein